MLLQVEVPAGLISGDPFNVEAGGLNFEICVPDGVGGGDLIDVDLPIDVPETPTTEQAGAQPLLVPVTLTVPDGVFPGMEMAVEWDGVSYNIAVPDGVGPGQEITVELPAAPQLEPEPMDTGGMDVSALSAALPPLPAGISVDAARYLEACDMSGEVRGNTGVGPYPMHTDGDFDLHQDVLVYRSDGSWTPATVQTYDERADTYDVEVEGGQMKYMVEMDCLMPIELMQGMVRHQGVKVNTEGKLWVWARIDDFCKVDDGSFFGSFQVTVELLDGEKRALSWNEWCVKGRVAKKPVVPEIWAYDYLQWE